MKSEWQGAVWTKSLPATVSTNCKRGGTTAIMEDKGLLMLFKVLNNIFNQGIREVTVFCKTVGIFEID